MSLAELAPIAFIPTTRPEEARRFYQETLGLSFVSDDAFALVFRVGPHGMMLRIVRAQDFTPAPFTIFGWEVTDIRDTIADLAAKGVTFLRFSIFEQDQHGVWTAPNGTEVAWFKDPDGNTLSLSSQSA